MLVREGSSLALGSLAAWRTPKYCGYSATGERVDADLIVIVVSVDLFGFKYFNGFSFEITKNH